MMLGWESEGVAGWSVDEETDGDQRWRADEHWWLMRSNVDMRYVLALAHIGLGFINAYVKLHNLSSLLCHHKYLGIYVDIRA